MRDYTTLLIALGSLLFAGDRYLVANDEHEASRTEVSPDNSDVSDIVQRHLVNLIDELNSRATILQDEAAKESERIGSLIEPNVRMVQERAAGHLIDLQQKMDHLRQHYGEDHPDIKRLRGEMEAAHAQIRRMQKEFGTFRKSFSVDGGKPRDVTLYAGEPEGPAPDPQSSFDSRASKPSRDEKKAAEDKPAAPPHVPSPHAMRAPLPPRGIERRDREDSTRQPDEHDLERRMEQLDRATKMLSDAGLEDEARPLSERRKQLDRELQESRKERARAEVRRRRLEETRKRSRSEVELERERVTPPPVPGPPPPHDEIHRALQEIRDELQGLRREIQELRETRDRGNQRTEAEPKRHRFETDTKPAKSETPLAIAPSKGSSVSFENSGNRSVVVEVNVACFR